MIVLTLTEPEYAVLYGRLVSDRVEWLSEVSDRAGPRATLLEKVREADPET